MAVIPDGMVVMCCDDDGDDGDDDGDDLGSML